MTTQTEVAKKKKKNKGQGRSKFLSALMRQISTDHGSALIKAFDGKDKAGFAEHFKTLGSKLRRSMSSTKTETAAIELSAEQVLASTSRAIVEAADLAEAHLDAHGLSAPGLRRQVEDAIIRGLAPEETVEVPAAPEASPQDAVEMLTYEDDKAARLRAPAAEGTEQAGAEVVLNRGVAFTLRPEGDKYILTAGEQTLTINEQTADALRIRSVA